MSAEADPNLLEKIGAGLAALGLGGWQIAKRVKNGRSGAPDWEALMKAMQENTQEVRSLASEIRGMRTDMAIVKDRLPR